MNKIVIIDTGVDINSTYIRKYVKDIVGIKVKKMAKLSMLFQLLQIQHVLTIQLGTVLQ